MQNSNPSHNPSPVPPPLSLDEALARTDEGARARILAGEQVTGDLFGAFTARTDAHPDDKARSPAAAEQHNDGAQAAPAGGARVTLDELLLVFRDPIEWVLTRAERHAQGDPVDLATLGRVRAAYQSRLAWIGSSGALGEARPNVRTTDLLTAACLFADSIDPNLLQCTSLGTREGLLGALAKMIPHGLAYAPGAATPPHPPGPCRCSDHIPDAPAPFGPPRASCPVAATCCCQRGHGF